MSVRNVLLFSSRRETLYYMAQNGIALFFFATQSFLLGGKKNYCLDQVFVVADEGKVERLCILLKKMLYNL